MDVRLRALDKGTEERWQHVAQQIKVVDETKSLVAFTKEENVLDVLFQHHYISEKECNAGLLFRSYFMSAGMGPNCTASYNPTARCGSSFFSSHDRNNEEEAAYQKWRSSMLSMSGAVNNVVESVCCYDAVPSPEKVAFLRVGLKQLIKFYGINL